MPIVISEFEIVPEPSPALDASATSPQSADQPESRPPTPYQVALAVRHEWRRHARVKAD